MNRYAINAQPFNHGASIDYAAQAPSGTVYYTCVLTGAGDGLADLVIPISAFTCRYRDAGKGYGSVTVPNGLAYSAGVAARPNGEVVVTWTQGALSEELLRFAPSSSPLNRGAKSNSMTLSGSFVYTARTPRVYDLEDVSYISTSGATRRLRAAGRGDIRPDDQVRHSNWVGTVTQVVWSVGEGISTMEVAA